VNETYHISQSFAKRQLQLTSGLTLVVVVGVGLAWWLDGALKLTQFLALAMVIAIAGVMYARNYKRALASIQNHALILASDAILIRDGAIERKIPYAAIELLKMPRPYFAESFFTLKIDGITSDKFSGYEDVDRLISTLMRRLPKSRVLDMRNHA
jgi:hypothetical protein